MFTPLVSQIIRVGLYALGWLLLAAAILLLGIGLFGDFYGSESLMRTAFITGGVAALSGGLVSLLLSLVATYLSDKMGLEVEEETSEDDDEPDFDVD